MATLMIQLPDDQCDRLQDLAKAKGIRINKLIEELSVLALTEFEAERRFKAMAAQGNSNKGLRLLEKLDNLNYPSFVTLPKEG